MLGAIAGDIIGSRFERGNHKGKDFELFTANSRFTDDTILSVAIADAIMQKKDFAKTMKQYARAYPNGGYGDRFNQWARSEATEPYNSWGNGSAMRVSPVGFVYTERARVEAVAQQTAEVTHNHPEGIKGAQATAVMILLAKEFKNKNLIRTAIESAFGYNLSRSLADIRPSYTFDVSCQGSVPEAMISFLEANSFEEAVRNAISLGGDTDTMGSIAGAIAEAFYGKVPDPIAKASLAKLDEPLRTVTLAFCEQYTHPYNTLLQ
ncbi:MAG: ADP-ribosylglycohydrolase family protein [Phormidesmis sp.]